MALELRRFPNGRYTLSESDPHTGETSERIAPPKFSPDDKYARFRYDEKKREWLSSSRQ